MGCLRIPAWPRVAELLFTPDVLRAAQACAAWHAMVDEAALWSARAVGRALEKLDACEAAAAASLAMSADARGRTARTARLGKLFALPAERRPKYANFVYGEVSAASLARLLGASGLRRGETFADLGSGAGRLLVTAAALAPLKAVVGVELLDGYVATAKRTLAHLGSVLGPDAPAVDLRHGSFTDEPDAGAWLEADVVIATSTCFEETQMRRIADLATGLRAGARVVTLDKRLPADRRHFRLLCTVACRGDWGAAVGYVQQRLPGGDGGGRGASSREQPPLCPC